MDNSRAVIRAKERQEEIRQEIENVASTTGLPTSSSVGSSTLSYNEDILDVESSQIRGDIMRLILQYLRDQGMYQSALALEDECNLRRQDTLQTDTVHKRIKQKILAGEWTEVESLFNASPYRSQKHFLYQVYKLQFLEMIQSNDIQKSLKILTTKLKPLEHLQTNPDEFKNLCYLLTCVGGNVFDSAQLSMTPTGSMFSGSKSTLTSTTNTREQLVEYFKSIVSFDQYSELRGTSLVSGEENIPKQRLVELLRQAVAYQIESSVYHPKLPPKVRTLLKDYRCFVLPNSIQHTFVGHRGNVKCVEFAGEEGLHILSGSSDNTLKVWDTKSSECVMTLAGHTSRIWDLSSDRQGRFVVSGSGDGSVKLWELHKGECLQTMVDHERDVYSVRFHPNQHYVASAGYDHTVRLTDIRTGSLVKTFVGHTSPVSTVIFNPHGNLIISGSKDCTIKFWDITSGVCIRSLSAHLGEVTSLECSTDGTHLLSSSKDNSNRLWDLRIGRPFRRFKGHQNTSKNFIRSSFGPDQRLVIGGSENSLVYIWDVDTGHLLQTLQGHQSIVYSAKWNENMSMLASCSDDYSVKTWIYNEKMDLFSA